jgi:hypothetical protein
MRLFSHEANSDKRTLHHWQPLMFAGVLFRHGFPKDFRSGGETSTWVSGGKGRRFHCGAARTNSVEMLTFTVHLGTGRC